MIEINDLSVTIKGKSILRNVSMSLGQGEVTALIGESGSGKSTTVAALLNILPPESKVAGSAQLNGQDLLDYTNKSMVKTRKQQVFTIFQDTLNSFNPSIKMKKQLYQLSGKKMGDSFSIFTNKMTPILKSLELSPEIMDQYPFELSGGMLQRCMIACAMYVKAHVLIADEPTSSIDMLLKKGFLGLLKRLNKEEGTTVLLITHDLDVAVEVADCLAVMFEGEIVEAGKTGTIMQTAQHAYTKKVVHSSFSRKECE